MADLTISLVDAGLDPAEVDFTLATVGADGQPFNPTLGVDQVIRHLVGRTSAAGTATVDITATDDWDQDDVFWRFDTAGVTRIFIKTDVTQALTDTEEVTAVPALPRAFMTTDMADWSSEEFTDGQVPTWDTDTERFEPGTGGGSGGAVASVNGETGVVELDAPDIPYDGEDNPIAYGANVEQALNNVDAQVNSIYNDQLPNIVGLIEAEAALARNADYLTSGTVADARIASTIARDSEVTAAAALLLAKASDLSDVASAATAFSNIKQAATTSATGVVELATFAETFTGTDAVRPVTPATFAAGVPSIVPASGDYWVPGGWGASTPNGFSQYEIEVAVEVWIPETATFDRICAYIDTLGASSVIRLGIRSPHATTHKPGTLLLDAGTAAASGTGAKEITISQQLTAGLWWLTATMQVSNTARGRAFSTSGVHPFGFIPQNANNASAPSVHIWNVGGVTGALTSTPTFSHTNSGGAGPPLVFLRRT